MPARCRSPYPEGTDSTITRRAACTCGHPAAHHDAGTCWTDDTGAEVWDATACQCPGFLPQGLLDAAEGTVTR